MDRSLVATIRPESLLTGTARPRVKSDVDVFGPMMDTDSLDPQKALKFYALSQSQETEPRHKLSVGPDEQT